MTTIEVKEKIFNDLYELNMFLEFENVEKYQIISINRTVIYNNPSFENCIVLFYVEKEER